MTPSLAALYKALRAFEEARVDPDDPAPVFRLALALLDAGNAYLAEATDIMARRRSDRF